MTSTHLVLRAVSNLPAQTGAVRLRSDFTSLQFQRIIMFRGIDWHSQLVPTVHVANRMPSVLFLCRAVEVEIQLLDRPLTGLWTKVVEEATPSLTPAFREGRAISPVSAARFSPQQVRILNWSRNVSLAFQDNQKALTSALNIHTLFATSVDFVRVLLSTL